MDTQSSLLEDNHRKMAQGEQWRKVWSAMIPIHGAVTGSLPCREVHAVFLQAPALHTMVQYAVDVGEEKSTFP
ncbi:hypothetical protein ACOMHN_003703 [Nucella lapillus]